MASWARFMREAATICIARVIWAMLRTLPIRRWTSRRVAIYAAVPFFGLAAAFRTAGFRVALGAAGFGAASDLAGADGGSGAGSGSPLPEALWRGRSGGATSGTPA